MAWYLAPSLVNLRNEIHLQYPSHKTDSDGSIGDDAHGETSSDHNSNSRGSVNAIDEDIDGLDCWWILECIKKHPSAHYFIWKPPGQKSQIWDSHNGWKPQTYTGSNPHDKHFHVSIYQSSSAEQNTKSWGIAGEGFTVNEDDKLKIHHAVWDDYTAAEYIDEDYSGVREPQTPKQTLYEVHANAVEIERTVNQHTTQLDVIENNVKAILDLLKPATDSNRAQ